MIRFCPNCQTERPLSEVFCDGTLEGAPCNWDLTNVTITGRGGPRSASEPRPPAPHACPQGHPAAPGDLLCLVCGAEISDPIGTTTSTPDGENEPADKPPSPREVSGWHMGRRLSDPGHVRQRFEAERASDGRRGVLTLYSEGAEPDPDVYAALRRVDLDHVAEIIEMGRLNGQAFVVSEDLAGGTLADLAIDCGDLATIRRLVDEIARALRDFAEIGLRHRDLQPTHIRIRTHEPLDLVITGFGSARLSELDLDIVSPLEVSRYMAPEAIMGGVTTASDWWSLGMIVLEIVTGGACFQDVGEQLFLIHVLSNGAPIPQGLDSSLDALLRGLLARDRNRRWQLKEVQAWLAGEAVEMAGEGPAEASEAVGPLIVMGGREFRSARNFALEASRAANWDAAAELLTRGAIATWAAEAGLEPKVVSGLRQLAPRVDVDADFRLAIALKLLNPALPLVIREVIISPGWLLDHPEAGYDLITGPVPDQLKMLGFESEDWLLRLARRAQSVRDRARALEIELDEQTVRLFLLSTSRARLIAIWDERRRLLPDTEHAGLASILDRPQTAEEDLVILCAASASQFRARDEILEGAVQVAAGVGLELGDRAAAEARLATPRRELLAELDRRIEGFARCGHDAIDAWADQFRLERRMPLERALALLAVPAERWQKPVHQDYVSALLAFFEKKVAGAILRGPLVRMTIGKTTPRVDLTELGARPAEATAVLEHLLQRTDRATAIDPQVFAGATSPEGRLRSLVTRTSAYQRDTGINGLYLGFPLLLRRDRQGANTRPRLAPVLLWPVKVVAEVGNRGRVTVAFDRDREEVRLNPAFEGMLGTEGAARWREAAQNLLARTSLRVPDVMDALGVLAGPKGRTLAALPGKEADVPFLADALVCSAVLFHVEFMGQAIVEDLRHLKGLPPAGSALEALLRIGAKPEPTDRPPPAAETERFFMAPSDPSQEDAVARAWQPPGLLVQGPPGTGKSQTIVNLVGDAVGRGKSLLVVCQKLPALEVVRKRLVAEGLGDRLMMVTDVNKDRGTIIRALRAQLEGLATQDPAQMAASVNTRLALATKISGLEAEIDRHHAALGRVDPNTNKTYRGILGELLALEAHERPCIDVTTLRRMLANVHPVQVEEVEETCGAISRDWLPACYENSPLAVLAEFPHDDATIADFERRFGAFDAAERARAQVLATSALGIELEDPAPFAAWLAAHERRFQDLDDRMRAALAHFLPLFRGDKPGKAYINALGALVGLIQWGARPCIEVPGLHEVLAAAEPGRTVAAADQCAALAELWLLARFEGNALVALAPFQPDGRAVAQVTEGLTAFVAVEQDRQRARMETAPGLETEDGASVAEWLERHEQPLIELAPERRQRLATWLPLFRDGGRGGEWLEGLDQAVARLAGMDEAAHDDVFFGFFSGLSPAVLEDWTTLARIATAEPASWFARLSFARFQARRKVAAQLQTLGEPATDGRMKEFLAMATLEEQLRGVRKAWKPICTGLGRATVADSPLALGPFVEQLESVRRDLRDVQALAARLADCPFMGDADQAAAAATRDAFCALFDRMRGAVARHKARARSLEALAPLKPWFTAPWVAACATAIRQARPTAESTGPVVAALPLLVHYQTFRLHAAQADALALQVFAQLAAARAVLELVPPGELANEVRRTINREIWLVHKGKLEAQERLLGALRTTDVESMAATLKGLTEIDALVASIDACPRADEAEWVAAAGSRLAFDAFFARIRGAIARYEARKRCADALAALDGWFADDWLAARRTAIDAGTSSSPVLEPIAAALPTLAAYQIFRIRARHLPASAMRVFEHLAAQRSAIAALPPEVLGQEIRRIVRREACLGWKTRLETAEPVLLQKRDELAFKVESLARADVEFRRRNREHLATHIDRTKLGTRQQWEDITRLQGARARRLREIISRGADIGLLTLRPVWLMNPEVASQLLPCARAIFDMVVYDEASQMPVEYALPTLYRAKNVVVSGDDKQMPPTSFFASKVESDEAEAFDGETPDESASEEERDVFEETWNRREIKDCPDLLHLAAAALPTVTLQIHYRSAYRELIAFSNAAFYRNELSVPVRHPDHEVRRVRPIEVVRADGEYVEQSNPTEAERVADVLADLWRLPPEGRPSVGVVTFNRKQAELIAEVLEKRAQANPDFKAAYAQELEREEGGEDMAIFVKNVENVQGDERDVIVFSTTFGRTRAGVFRRNFGVLGQKGGERRLNVAVTRARKKVAIVTSIPINDISDLLASRRDLAGPRDYLQAYLEYARLLSGGELEAAEALRTRLTASSQAKPVDAGASDGLARSVDAYLRQMGLAPVRAGEDPALGVDFAIVNPRTGLFGIGIECEAPRHRLLAKARAREIWRPAVLARAYPMVHRVSAHAWYHDRDQEQARLARAVEQALAKP